MKKKTAKEVKVHTFLDCACKSQDFAQIQKISRGRTIARFRNSGKKTSFFSKESICNVRCVMHDIRQSIFDFFKEVISMSQYNTNTLEFRDLTGYESNQSGSHMYVITCKASYLKFLEWF